MSEPDVLAASQRYLDELFGPGAGERHSRFIDGIDSPPLREALHRCHLLEADQALLTTAENYLLGVAVLCTTRHFGPAGMFAKTLRQLGVPRAKVMAAVGRLAMWIGPIPAAEAAAHVQRALDDWDQRGAASLAAWFPEPR